MLLPKTGDIVVAIVKYLTTSNIMCSVIAKENLALPNVLPATIRISDMTNVVEYKGVARPNELYKVGDYILARVLTASERILMLTTAEEKLGRINKKEFFAKLDNALELKENNEETNENNQV